MNNSDSNTEIVTLNMEAIRQTAKMRFMAARRRKRTLRDWIEGIVPLGLIVIVIAVLLLSAPHTATMFNMITPGWGGAGVLLVEFGLVYLAFRRRQDGKLPRMLRAFEVLLFLAAIIVNGAGALVAVATMTGIQSMSAGSIYAQFWSLPITAQVGLSLVPLAAVLIPIGTFVSGEGFANLVLHDREVEREAEREWSEHEQIEVYRESYSHLLHQGVNARDAQRRAGSATTNFYQAGLTIEIPSMPVEATIEAVSVERPQRTTQRPRRPSSRVQSPASPTDPRKAVRDYLNSHPEAADLSVRNLAAAVGVGRTVAHEELSAFKQKGDVE